MSQLIDFSTFQSQSRGVWQSLQSASMDASASLARWRILLFGSVVAAIETELTGANVIIGKLAPDGLYTLKVQSGDWSVAQWQEQADNASAAIADALTQTHASAPTFDRITSEIIAPTVAEVTADVKKAAEVGTELVPWIAAALIAGVLGYIIFTFRRV